jgi:alpha-1,3-glucan synthase
MPWASDGFGPLDFTLLDHHHGRIEDWRALITELHRRGMYVLLDNTMATMGNLLAFVGYENATTPFTYNEYQTIYKSDRVYHDFQPGQVKNNTCVYPRMYGEDGYPLHKNITDQQIGCMESEYDQVSLFFTCPFFAYLTLSGVG